MSALAFDTYAAIKKLKEAGFTEQQAEAQTALLSEIAAGELATKRDMKELESSLKQELRVLEERTEGRFKLLQWMVGFNLALTIAVLFLLLRH
jgi:hypothetical protein